VSLDADSLSYMDLRMKLRVKKMMEGSFCTLFRESFYIPIYRDVPKWHWRALRM
jgi:hypothetical protein